MAWVQHYGGRSPTHEGNARDAIRASLGVLSLVHFLEVTFESLRIVALFFFVSSDIPHCAPDVHH